MPQGTDARGGQIEIRSDSSADECEERRRDSDPTESPCSQHEEEGNTSDLDRGGNRDRPRSSLLDQDRPLVGKKDGYCRKWNEYSGWSQGEGGEIRGQAGDRAEPDVGERGDRDEGEAR